MKSSRYLILVALALAVLLSLGISSGLQEGPLARAQGQAECTVTVQPGESIQTAIDAAADGDVICLAEGTWEENVKIEKSLTLQGVDQEKTIIKGQEEGYPVIWITTPEEVQTVSVKVEGLKITGALDWCADWNKWICAFGMLLQGSAQVIVASSQVSDNGDDGICVGDSAQATIENSQISNNKSNGIYLRDSARTVIENSQISYNGKNGIRLGWDSTQATIENNTIQGNKECGIWSSSDKLVQGKGNRMSRNGADLCGNLSAQLRIPLVPETKQTELNFPGTYPSLQATIDALASGGTITITAGEHPGSVTIWKPLTLRGAGQDWTAVRGAVSLIDGAQDVQIEGMTFTGSTFDGLLLGGQAQATVYNSRVSDSRLGIDILGSAQLSIINSMISNNENGIDIWGSAHVTIIDSQILGNEWTGIDMWDFARATIANSQVVNKYSGIMMSGSTQAIIINSQISNSESDGISLEGSARAIIENSVIQDNKECGIWSSSDKPVQGRGNRMSRNGADLCGNLSASLRIPLVPETEKRELNFPGSYPTLQETIDALAPGGTITLALGRHQGCLTIWKPLTLKGADPEEVVIGGAISLINEAQGVEIEGVTITGSPGNGLMLGGRSQATISGSTVKGNERVGIDIGGSAQATITSSTVKGNRWDGIRIGGSAQAELVEDRIIANEGYGVALYEPCFIDWVFRGYVAGRGNEIPGPDEPEGNKQSAVCPEELDFLMTEQGGEYHG